MAVSVIVFLEVIRIDEQQRQATIVALKSGPFVFEYFIEGTTVLESCQRVGLRQLRKPHLRLYMGSPYAEMRRTYPD